MYIKYDVKYDILNITTTLESDRVAVTNKHNLAHKNVFYEVVFPGRNKCVSSNYSQTVFHCFCIAETCLLI